MEFDPKIEFLSDIEEEEDTENAPENAPQRKQMTAQDVRLYLIRRTVLQMLRDRGYIIGDMEISMSSEDFWEKYGSDISRPTLDLVRVKQADPTEQIFVFFPEEAKVGVSVIKRYAEIMKENNVALAILVVQRKLTLYGQQSVSEMSGKYRIEVFQETELLVNIKESVLVPEHQVLTSDEQKEILERYSAKSTQLPRLPVDDPVARYYGMRKGQMVKIIRPDQGTDNGSSVTYRLVV